MDNNVTSWTKGYRSGYAAKERALEMALSKREYNTDYDNTSDDRPFKAISVGDIYLNPRAYDLYLDSDQEKSVGASGYTEALRRLPLGVCLKARKITLSDSEKLAMVLASLRADSANPFSRRLLEELGEPVA